MTKRPIPLNVLLLGAVLPCLLVAQRLPPITPPGPGVRPLGPLLDLHGPTVTIAGAPFQAQRVGQSIQQLPDGSTLTQEVHGLMARDSQGRVRVEQQMADQPTTVVVIDPVNHISLRWDNTSKVATQTALPFELHLTFPLLTNPPWISVLLELESTGGSITREDLGQKTINGILVMGTRTATPPPSPKIVHEVWFSDALKLAVLDTVENPAGKQTLEMRDVMHMEPDPMLFQLPQGYTVRQLSLLPRGGVAGGVVGGTVDGTRVPTR